MSPLLFLSPPAVQYRHSRRPARFTASATLPLSTPTVARPKRTLSHAQILAQTSEALQSLSRQSAAAPRLTVDFPPERSEQRSGTLVARYENHMNFIEKLILSLGCRIEDGRSVGPSIDIRDNINPQGGGEYLSDDEAMVGLRVSSCPALDGRGFLALINAGVDVTTLKQVKDLDVERNDVVVLLNCGLERLSWFARFGIGDYFDQYQTAYYLKNVGGNGWLIKKGDSLWQTYVVAANGEQLIAESTDRPKIVDAEAQVRLAIAGIPPPT